MAKTQKVFYWELTGIGSGKILEFDLQIHKGG
jgi:hypothetical protein